MCSSEFLRTVSKFVFGCGVVATCGWRAEAADFVQTSLVSDIPGLAEVTDPALVNPWGLSHRGGSPFWVSDQGTNLSTLYAVTGGTNAVKIPLDVSIPTAGGGPAQGPTGQVSNSLASSFPTGSGGSSLFIFANLNGTISAWNGSSGTSAAIEVATPGAIYTGLAINDGQTMLYAANAATHAIDTFNSSFAPVHLGGGAFATPAAIAAKGLVPFNVQDINGDVYVTYAVPGHEDQESAGLGKGAVAKFSESGALEMTLLGGPTAPLASPWGIALAPPDFGAFSNDLLVGNFSFVNSEINAFDPTTGALVGSIGIDPGASNTPGGLWALEFGGGGNAGSPNVLYFTDGINGEDNGLFGAISVAAPETSAWVMMLAGFGGIAVASAARTRRRSPISID